MINRLLLALFSFTLFILIGCSDVKNWFAKEFRQGDVTSGIARLSALNLSIITSEISKRFNEPNVTVELARDAKEIGKGWVTKTITDLDINYPQEQVVHKDCKGNEASFSGMMHVVKATQTIYGRLTNNPLKPIIPDPLGIKMTVHVKPHHSHIKFSSKDASMELADGDLKFEAYPRLAQSQREPLRGVRLIPTANTRFENVVMKDIKGTLYSKEITLPFDISNSHYFIQVGVGENGDENKIEGEITAFGKRRTIPVDGNKLDIHYQSKDFAETYSCNEGLDGIVEYNNVLFEHKLAPGMAGLTTLVMGKIAGKLADDHICGMSSPDFLRSTQLTGEPGKSGKAYAQVNGPCRIRFEEFQTEPDCFGIAHVINGEATVTAARKTTKGVLFYGNDDFKKLVEDYEKNLATNPKDALKARPEPILPNLRQPVVLEISADLSNVIITEVCINQGSTTHDDHCRNNKKFDGTAFSINGGEVSVMLKPLMGKSTDPNDDAYQMCSVKNVPIIEAQLQLKDVQASIRKAGNEISLSANGAYRAINGFIDEQENELSGELSIGKVLVPFRSDSHTFVPLKPDYDRKRFEDSFQSCRQGKFIVPQTDRDCSLDELLGTTGN